MKKSKGLNHNSKCGLLFVTLILIASLLVVATCSGPKVYKVGILSNYPPFNTIAEGFKVRMTELGYIEGKNITYDVQTKETDPAWDKEVIKAGCDAC